MGSSFLGVPVPLLIAVAIAVVALSYVWGVPSQSPRWPTLAGRAALVGGAALVALIGALVVIPPSPLVQAELEPGGPGLEVPAEHGRVSLLLHGQLPPVEAEHEVASHWFVSVWDGPKRVQAADGMIDERWNSVRVGRGRGSMPVAKIHTDQRVDLIAAPEDHPLTVKLDKMPGNGPHTLHVAVVPAPPPMWLISTLGGAVALAGAGADAVRGRVTGFALGTGFLAVFAVILFDATPAITVLDVGWRAGLAAVAGVIGGAGLRWVLHQVVLRVRRS